MHGLHWGGGLWKHGDLDLSSTRGSKKANWPGILWQWDFPAGNQTSGLNSGGSASTCLPAPGPLCELTSSFSPEFVCSLDASDEFLKERVMNLPESIVTGTHYSQDRFLRALSNYRDVNTEDETVLNYFDELEIHPVHIGTE